MDKTNKWAEELLLLRQIIEPFPFEETIKWGSPVFTFNGKNVISFAGFKDHFALWFFNGSHLEDHASVLIATQGDKTKNLRQWKFTDRSQIEESVLKQYIQEAIDIEQKGLKIIPGKKEYLPIPALLQFALDQEPVLKKAFEKLSLAKQNEYNEFIHEAKQDKTKLARIEKIKPNILGGKSLHDQYKK
ncbi:DUF1801 domain-containing protein [Sphingobacterium sp. SRCM116780]|uniref:YdeI/OmpD-associated family protein n=1 Tax=Sphingobacterium sp. SRCM116780 TaxID=2907623 RepID=UPI001F2E4F76|nr:DUF1801 domain-containing protein [Sphingobacterium sp. SRCM116780]UIR56495.1 DUF1801 domain-containing protein [Sphingobacterium sp. SRCM116780]